MATKRARAKTGKKFQSAVERTAREEMLSLLRTAKLQRRIGRLAKTVDRGQARLRRQLLDFAALWAKENGYKLERPATGE